ncbi:hypothetical protein [Streptomyces sp. NBC_01264]|uniref:hypothetical protein n=1 Tax=Streptomyces sp. NBC_01264 TaxID=2903804 RepID=UPI00225971A4|nr:hypothetical protein [Streptomyces sp. NBC_01264]MCX4775591.1 hypothetical protein [Streptomyces sp. NBC_01264]
MDVESVAAELYGLRPSEFTAARNARVAKARKAGDKGLAKAIGALRRPTVAAWTAGLLARRRPEEAHGLVQLGEALRTAHRTLDAGQLRKLSHDQHVVIGELARTARTLADEAGQAVSESVQREVEQILHAVLADAGVAAQWEAGRLATTPDLESGFAGLEPQPGAAPPRSMQPPPAGSPTGHRPPPAPAPAPDADADADAATARARRERVEAAEGELAEARAEVERLEAGQAAALELVERARAAVEAAEEGVQAATRQLEAARAAKADAVAGRREAGRAAAKARTRVKAAARKVERLTSS